MKWPYEELNQISTREDLALYLQDLSRHLDNGELVPFENSDTVRFVDAAGRWTGAMQSVFANVMGEKFVPDQPTWSMVGAIFRAAVMFE